MIDDAGLSRFALGVAPAAGVMLAVLVSFLIFQLAGISVAEREAMVQIRAAAYNMYELLLSQIRFARIYFKDPKDFEGFSHRISSLSNVTSFEEIPDYLSWKIHTADILQIANFHLIRSEHTEEFSEGEERFHFDFAHLMAQLDAGIRYNHTSVIIPQKVASVVKTTSGIAAGLLLLSIITALAAELRYGRGIPDYLNLAPTGLLLSLIISLLFLFAVLVVEVGRSSRKAIDAAAERQVKIVQNLQNSKNSSPAARIWGFIRRPTP